MSVSQLTLVDLYHIVKLLFCPKIVQNTEQKATIHQVTTMLATSKNAPFPSPNHLLTTGTDDPSIKVMGHQHRWLAWWLGAAAGNRHF